MCDDPNINVRVTDRTQVYYTDVEEVCEDDDEKRRDRWQKEQLLSRTREKVTNDTKESNH
jgi:hypothetical protein